MSSRIKVLFLIIFMVVGCHKKTSHSSQNSNSALVALLKSAGFEDAWVGDDAVENGSSELVDSIYEVAMKINQPVDHFSKDSPTFKQLVVFSYVNNFNPHAPVFFEPLGYSWSLDASAYPTEFVTKVVQVAVEHRYYGTSTPSPTDYSYLTFEQSAADHHHIVEVLQKHLNGPWISMGESKGGEAAILHRYYYPNDVRGTIANVAPLFQLQEDDRMQSFITSHVSDECIQTAKTLQIEMLKRKDTLLPIMLASLSDTQDVAVNNMRYETQAVDLFFVYLQHILSSVNPSSCKLEDYSSLSDNDFYQANIQPYISPIFPDWYRPFIYQQETQAGAFKNHTEYLNSFLKSKYDDLALLLPTTVVPAYDGSTIEKVIQWLQTDAKDIIFTYGDLDIFSAAKIDPANNSQIKIFTVPDGSHFSTRFHSLDKTRYKEAFDLFNSWQN